MINNQVEFYPFFKGNKLKVIVKMDLLDALEQIYEQIEITDELESIEFIASVNDELENLGTTSSCSVKHFSVSDNVITINAILHQRKKEKRKEKERKEINKEKKDRENNKENKKVSTVGNTGKNGENVIDLDVTDEVFVEHTKAQQVNKKFKQQYDTKPLDNMNKWTSNDFLKYMQDKYRTTYGYNSMEFEVFGGKKYGKSATGVIFTHIKRKLMDVFVESGLDMSDLKNYIDWVYDKKSGELNFPVTLNFIASKALMTDWTHAKHISKNKNNKKFSFSKKIHSNIKK